MRCSGVRHGSAASHSMRPSAGEASSRNGGAALPDRIVIRILLVLPHPTLARERRIKMMTTTTRSRTSSSSRATGQFSLSTFSMRANCSWLSVRSWMSFVRSRLRFSSHGLGPETYEKYIYIQYIGGFTHQLSTTSVSCVVCYKYIILSQYPFVKKQCSFIVCRETTLSLLQK